MDNVRTPYGSAAQRVLAIPEIIDNVFSFMERRDNTKNALVCKQWSELALDHLWRKVDDLHRLFSLLAPIRCDSTVWAQQPVDPLPHKFEHPLQPRDWTRFKRYARSVRSLEFSADPDKALRGPHILDEVARTRSALDILPRLASLVWLAPDPATMRLACLFMHARVARFAVALRPAPDYALGVFFQEIALRMPRLAELDLRFSFPVRDVEQELCELVDSLYGLRKVVLPRFALSAAVFEALSRLPHLRVVQFEFGDAQGAGDPRDVDEWQPALQPGAFPALVDLSLGGIHLSDVTRVLAAEHFPQDLQILYVYSLDDTDSPTAIADFYAALAERCPRLTQTSLDFLGSQPELVLPSEHVLDERLPLAALTPILACEHLTVLELWLPAPLALTDADAATLAAALPSLERLELNTDAVPCAPPPALTLAALPTLARACPRLRELGVLLDATSVPAAPVDTPFACLGTLRVGRSPIADSEAVALFLSALCPPQCTLISSTAWGALALPPDVDIDGIGAMGIWVAVWEDVARVLPLLARLRVAERARAAELEREVDDWRTREGVVRDRRRSGGQSDGCVIG